VRSEAARAAHWRKAFADALEAARQRFGRRDGFIGVIEAYCESPACSVRVVEINIKEYDGPTPSGFQCPACYRALKLHHVQTLAEHERSFERSARRSVNLQLYVQRERQRTGEAVIQIPLNMFDDALPQAKAAP